MDRGVAVVTGASSGIGAASARRLAVSGFTVVLGARREDRLQALQEEIGEAASWMPLDVADPRSVTAFCEQIPECRLLLNNAGGALGQEPILEADERHYLDMFQSNALGTVRMTKALLPKLIESGDGHVITIGSVAAFEAYIGGAGYNAAKFATRAVMEVLRLELLGKPVRVSEIDPGMVETEFSLVRFDGDEARAAALYEGMTPLSAEDVADVIDFVATRPSHVDVDQLILRPRDQARVGVVARNNPGAP
jgi:NADP-dependent 3-hydroxy acid dehydrogenase YdfG